MKCWCDKCKSALDNDDLVLHKEWSEAWGRPVYEERWVCPNCGEVPVDYDNQDKTCEDCVFYGEEECPYGWEGAREKVCGDFEEGE